jgi:predicted RNA-binding Zn-ribbon protein involved in translation (DUF1610 family)
VRAPGPQCEACGYSLRGVPSEGGAVTCPECGVEQVPRRVPESRWARWTFALGVAGPTYLMAASAQIARWLGDFGMATALYIFILLSTLGLALYISRDVAPRRASLPVRLVCGVVAWALLNAPPTALVWSLWR